VGGCVCGVGGGGGVEAGLWIGGIYVVFFLICVFLCAGRAIKEKFRVAEMIHRCRTDLVNAKPLWPRIRSFLGSSQLSQFNGPEQPRSQSRTNASLWRLGRRSGRVSARARSARRPPTHYGRISPMGNARKVRTLETDLVR